MSQTPNGDHPPDGDELEDLDDRHRALADRLRRLRWPEPPPGARERRLAELREVLARGTATGEGAPAERDPDPERDG